MALLLHVRPNEYRDSGTLMMLAKRLGDLGGIRRASAIMATPRNFEMLVSLGFASPEALPQCTPSDLLVVIDADSDEAARDAVSRIDSLFVRTTTTRSSSNGSAIRSLDAAIALRPANLAMISVPGPFAAREARRALRAGLHVFLFSNGVSVDDEISLKREARERGLLLMGPDCGTAIIDGVPIGFANRVRRGTIGLVGASGTGLQEVTTLIDRLGGGVSHAIGTGSRDLSATVGGASTLDAIALLSRDAATESIMVVSKPPAPEIAARVLDALARCGKPAIACFVGFDATTSAATTVQIASTLEEAATIACGNDLSDDASIDIRAPKSGRLIRGLFSGGTLGYEALALLAPHAAMASNLKFAAAQPLANEATIHSIIDLGDDEFTRGRPHPMIDPSIRIGRIRALANDPRAGILLLDIVLGFGAHPDPAGALVDAIRAIPNVTVIASVCGTDADPQSRHAQVETLRSAGVLVARSNAEAARIAGAAAGIDVAAAPHNRADHMRTSHDRSEAPPLFGAPLSAINLGLDSFAETLDAVHVPATRIDWRPPAGGDEGLARILDQLM